MKKSVRNIYSVEGVAKDKEFSELILSADGEFKMERVISFGHPSPDGFWYDQLEDEWVLLAKGSAQIEFERGDIVDMIAGDYLVIMAGMRHKVTEVTEDAVWLGFFF